MRKGRICCSISFGEYRGDQHRDCCEKEQAGLKPGGIAVVLPRVMGEAAEQKRGSEHEQRVRDDRPDDRSLHQDVLTGAQRGQRDQQLGQIAQSRVEQAADQIAGLGSHRLGGSGRFG